MDVRRGGPLSLLFGPHHSGAILAFGLPPGQNDEDRDKTAGKHRQKHADAQPPGEILAGGFVGSG